MPCARDWFDDDKRWAGFLCGEGIEPCRFCGFVSDYLCDFPVASGATCDAPLCDRHAIGQGGDLMDIHFCPTHVIMARGLVRTNGGAP